MELKVEDLYHPCAACEGKGVLPLKVEAGDAVMMVASPKCEACDGMGVILTDMGRVLEGFIKLMQERKR